jgi:hypothetical protein
MSYRIERLSENNFADYEKLTSCESGGGCYCAFWHQKITSMQEWDQRKQESPGLNRQTILDKVRTGYHVGVLVYRNQELVDWISVGTLPESYWTWKRVAQVGEEANLVAGITCITISPQLRSQKLQAEILLSLKEYGKSLGWKSIEGYPYEEKAYQTHGKAVAWPGKVEGFVKAGFEKVGPHWLNHPEWERSIYRISL